MRADNLQDLDAEELSLLFLQYLTLFQQDKERGVFDETTRRYIETAWAINREKSRRMEVT